jgi:hypothetical protein
MNLIRKVDFNNRINSFNNDLRNKIAELVNAKVSDSIKFTNTESNVEHNGKAITEVFMVDNDILDPYKVRLASEGEPDQIVNLMELSIETKKDLYEALYEELYEELHFE